MFIDLRERERNINWLPPVHTLTRDWTHNLLVYGTTLQPTEPPGQGVWAILDTLGTFSNFKKIETSAYAHKQFFKNIFKKDKDCVLSTYIL